MGAGVQKVGEYWVPDLDMRWFRNRRKTLENYRDGGHGKQIGHLAQALAGAAQTLARCQPYVMMELKERHLARGTAGLSAHEARLARGYRIVADLGQPVLDRLYVPAGRD